MRLAVQHPMIISSRLMPALHIDGVGTLHIEPIERDYEGRIRYRYVIDDADRTELETGTDLYSGVGADVDLAGSLATLISFLTESADRYRTHMQPVTDDPLFTPDVQEWAYLHSDDLTMAQLDLEGSDQS